MFNRLIDIFRTKSAQPVPKQPPEIADSVQTATLTPALREALKAASPHCLNNKEDRP